MSNFCLSDFLNHVFPFVVGKKHVQHALDNERGVFRVFDFGFLFYSLFDQFGKFVLDFPVRIDLRLRYDPLRFPVYFNSPNAKDKSLCIKYLQQNKYSNLVRDLL